MIEKDIRAYLVQQLSCPVYVGNFPQCDNLPAIAYAVTGSEHQYTLQGLAGLAIYDVSFDVWANTYEETIDISKELKDALAGLEISGGYYCQLESETDGTESNEGEETFTYHRMNDYRIFSCEG